MGIMFMELKVSHEAFLPPLPAAAAPGCSADQPGADALPTAVLPHFLGRCFKESTRGWTEGALKHISDPPEAGAD